LFSTFWTLPLLAASPMSRFSTSPILDLPSPPLPTMSIIFCPLVLGIRQ